MVRMLLYYFNGLEVMRRSAIRANDIQHIITVKNDPENGILACGGWFVASQLTVFKGILVIKPNAAGDMIAYWDWGF